MTWFEPPPSAEEIPVLLNSPFDADAPEPLAAQAAAQLMAQLKAREIAPGISTSLLHGPQGGKMFGVLVVKDRENRVGFLRAFSGQLNGKWELPGYVPPVFDQALRAAVEPKGEVTVKSLTARVEAEEANPARLTLAAELEALRQTQQAALDAMKEKHDARKRERRAQRVRLSPADPRLDALDRQSQADDAELRLLKTSGKEERLRRAAPLRALERKLRALRRLRHIVSLEVSRQLYDTYLFENALGNQTTLRGLFFPHVPSSGTGDCAAPKLLVYALRHGLKPLAMAEFWWGAAPPGGARTEGHFYPACKDKCGPLLPFLLNGLDVRPSRRFRPPSLSPAPLPVIFQDEHIIVVNKPEGLLSIRGTDATVHDSVQARIRAQFPHATGPLIVHRLDLETSGLMLLALTESAYQSLQAQFTQREVKKRYTAILDGVLNRDEGTIELPLRVDLEQRPRQIVDFEHGKPAITTFKVLSRAKGKTRIAFFPLTGRTHQLRVHASHREGLGIPIVGDRLYGTPHARLALHAEQLEVRHPATGAAMLFSSPAPF
ncbi:MAG: RluA family pseudouridine synthase [Myxococcaceae bacterium]|nr:RluA family pseudouridine synthase [Myxococcaceae bacterium]